MDISKNSWLNSCKCYNITIKDGKKYLTVHLYDTKGNLIKNKIRLVPLLENYKLDNNNGILKYNLTKNEDEYV